MSRKNKNEWEDDEQMPNEPTEISETQLRVMGIAAMMDVAYNFKEGKRIAIFTRDGNVIEGIFQYVDTKFGLLIFLSNKARVTGTSSISDASGKETPNIEIDTILWRLSFNEIIGLGTYPKVAPH